MSHPPVITRHQVPLTERESRERQPADRRPGAVVFGPAVWLTVTVESMGDDDEIHLHPGGQGFWIARMLRELERNPILCAPLGGESGHILRCMFQEWQIPLAAVQTTADTPTRIQDRRSGSRQTVAETQWASLSRHEADTLYNRCLELALSTGVCVVTGYLGEMLPPTFYTRLGHDLAATDVTVVADIHGQPLEPLLDGGPIHILKMSQEDAMADGLTDQADEASAREVAARLSARGAELVVLTRGGEPALAAFDDKLFRVHPPVLEPADHLGAGDAMTAGLAAAAADGADLHETLKLGSGAGAANVTRHGLGSGSKELVAELAERTVVEFVAHLP